jgi:hypothetical protein
MSINIKGIIRKIFFGDDMPKDVRKIFDKMHQASFPGGVSQIHEEAEMLHVILKRRVSIESLERILAATKPLFLTRNSIDTKSLTLIDDFLFQQRAPSINQEDIQVIHEFYINYFNLRGRSSASSALPSFVNGAFKSGDLTESTRILVEPDSIEVRLERDGVFWGIVSIHGGKATIKNANQKHGFVSSMLHMAVAAARMNLTLDDKLAFCRWAVLPIHEWSGLHYSTFAFAFTKWLSIPNPVISRSEMLSKVQKLINESFEVSWNLKEFDEEVEAVFANLFTNFPV